MRMDRRDSEAAGGDGPVDRIRVLVADDEPAVRTFLAGVVGSGKGLELVASAADATEAVDLTTRHRPDVAVIDVNMPGGGGPRATREIRLSSPNTRVLALSASHDHAAVMEMLRSGASGYVVKGAPITEILDGIREAARGQAPLSSEVARDVVSELTGRLEREAGEARRGDEVIERIRAVMDRDLLSVVFQPIFDVERGWVVGAEALARFEAEPRRGPQEWFAEAASVGLGVELELWAARLALRHLGSLPPTAYVAVNLSPDVVQSANLTEVVSPRAARRAVVEITEHAPVGDYRALAQSLQDFRSGGGRVAIDDAGAGFASLRHIVRLDPNIIKLDISLTRDVHLDPNRRALAAALISFAQETGMVIVAEGVEHPDELTTLRELGVAQAQGCHLARPVPPGELERIWRLPLTDQRLRGASA